MAATRFTVDPNLRLLLRDLGMSERGVLRRAELPADLLARASVELRPEEYDRLWRAIEADSPIDDLAVAIGQAISVEMFAPPLFAALCSPNLALAAARIADYKPLIGPMAVEVDDTPATLTIACRWPKGSDPPATIVHVELFFWVALARLATRHPVRLVAATSPHAEAASDAVAEFLGCDLAVGPTPTVSFDRIDARRTFLTENEAMWRTFAPELRRRLADLDREATAVDRVRAALLETLPAGESSIASVTDHLAVGRRTLQRQLQQGGHLLPGGAGRDPGGPGPPLPGRRAR